MGLRLRRTQRILMVAAIAAGSAALAGQEPRVNLDDLAIREFGRIEWHGDTATLVSGGSRPLRMAALALSTCLGIAVSSEEPAYQYLGDVLDVAAPEWTAEHPNSHAYAPRPARLEITFDVSGKGYPRDLAALLRDSVRQINQQTPFAFKVREQVHPGRRYFSFVPTRTRNKMGQSIELPSYLDTKVTIPLQTARAASLAGDLSRALARSVGRRFACCQDIVAGVPWGMNYVTHGASDRAAREVLEDLIDKAGLHQSYSLTCEPFRQRACFISLHEVSTDRKPRSDGVCSALGYDGY